MSIAWVLECAGNDGQLSYSKLKELLPKMSLPTVSSGFSGPILALMTREWLEANKLTVVTSHMRFTTWGVEVLFTDLTEAAAIIDKLVVHFADAIQARFITFSLKTKPVDEQKGEKSGKQ